MAAVAYVAQDDGCRVVHGETLREALGKAAAIAGRRVSCRHCSERLELVTECDVTFWRHAESGLVFHESDDHEAEPRT